MQNLTDRMNRDHGVQIDIPILLVMPQRSSAIRSSHALAASASRSSAFDKNPIKIRVVVQADATVLIDAT